LGAEGLPEKLSDMSADYFLQVIEEKLLDNVKNGNETVIIIDEAHVIIEPAIFEELRLLLNFQFEDKFLLTLILMGQPELKTRIMQNKQFSQRIAIGYSLGPLSEAETKIYIEHRLEVAGAGRQIFRQESINPIFQNSGGIPRRINQICDMSLMTGFNNEVKDISSKIVNEAVDGIGV
ncbi:MAG: AAA family ATPase, partial [Candidatus Margulisiibacteriota bacterium]